MNGDVDGAGLRLPDSSWDKVAGLTGEMGVFVLLGHSVLQGALYGVEAAVLTNQCGQQVDIWSSNREERTHQRDSLGPRRQERNAFTFTDMKQSCLLCGPFLTYINLFCK